MAVKVALNSLGCAKNLVDAERLLYTLYNGGCEILSGIENADVVIVNTCAFIDSAKQEGIDTILEYAGLKSEGKLKGIVVTGCMAQRYADEIRSYIPEVNCVVSPGHNPDILRAVEAAAAGQTLTLHNAPEELPLTGERIRSTPDGWAYLKIADGCGNRCSFCAIPSIRGPMRSVPPDELIREARSLCEGGRVSELVLIAQDTTRYGSDLDEKTDLPALLEALSKIEECRYLRVLYMHPDRVDDRIIDAIAQNPKVANYFDIPVQHADDAVLRSMNRSRSGAELLELTEKIRAKAPGAVLRTTLMTGFPTEDSKAYERLLSFVEKARFERLGCFVFSPQEGTPAAEMKGGPGEKTARRRRGRVMELAKKIAFEAAGARVGQTAEVLTEGFDKYAGYWFGRSYAEAPEEDPKIFFKGAGLSPGKLVRVRLCSRIDYDLIGEIRDE